MKRPILNLLMLFGLLGLLILLAILQYRWLGEISQVEGERMRERLEADARHFADDFNGEIRKSYFIFQLDPNVWLDRDWKEFSNRYQLWLAQTKYKNLIGEFYFVEKDKNPIKYDSGKNEFVLAQTTAELEKIKEKLNRAPIDFHIAEPLVEDNYTILMANFDSGEVTGRDENNVAHIEPKILGILVIKLDENVVQRLLSDLANSYFPPDNTYNYNLSIVKKSDGEEIFKSNENLADIDKDSNDFSIPIFDLSVENFNMITKSNIFVTKKSKTGIFIERGKLTGKPTTLPNFTADKNLKVQIFDDHEPAKKRENKGIWLLNIKHSTGSLEQFIANTRNKNLAISFGILALLAISIILIFVSAQRAKRFAQKQVDFVSAVSHEFRTPLAVIYSAGENLTDGVVNSETQVAQYGDLIKGEGRKLSAMVEQILEFAGARSGKRKYDFREANVREIVENALKECQPLLREKNFTVEKEIAENLPGIAADENALSQAIQNLIANSIKYANGNSWLKISAINGGGKVKIAVEDKGIGIAPNDLKHVFEPFYRSKQVIDEQIHGNGLGLSLVRQTVEAHGGEIEARSEIGKGSEFTIELPGKIFL